MSQNEFKITPIGSIQVEGNKQMIIVDEKYRKALKNLSMFSHAIIIYKGNNPNILNTNLCQKVIELSEVDEKQGRLAIYCDSNLETTNLLYDIKPYFPNEDRVKGAVAPNSDDHLSLYNQSLSKLGTIRKIKGSYYLEIPEHFDDYVEALQAYSHIKIIWWFDKFEKDIYKTSLVGNPPYENAPKTGVFASRSPVRPNPLAITTAKILEIDNVYKRIKVSLLDCFDKTILLGISPYIPEIDCISEYRLPSWVKHWSKYLDDRDFEFSDLPTLSQAASTMINAQNEISLSNEVIQKENYFEMNKKHYTSFNQGIEIKGARQHNLKNIDVTIPYNKITVITGVSGSGKSSLAFDTIFAESQQRFFSNMSLSDRSRFSLMDKPNFDYITGLPPAIAISQNSMNRNPRSTVGTSTDIYNLLRTLFANIGVRHCPECGRAIDKMTIEEITDCLKQCEVGQQIIVSPFGQDDLKKYIIIIDKDNENYERYLNELGVIVKDYIKRGNGAIQVVINNEKFIFQTTEKCYHCDHILFEMTASDFSFNNSESMCPVCNGLGIVCDVDENSIIKYPEKSILDGASEFWGSLRKFQKAPNANWMRGEILALANTLNIDLEKPWKELPEIFKTQAIYGTGKQEVTFSYSIKSGRTGTITRPVEGVYNIIKRLSKSFTSDGQQSSLNQFMKSKTCSCCNGERLKLESRIVTIHDKRFPEIMHMNLEELNDWILNLPSHLNETQRNLVQTILQELHTKLSDYVNIGLDYLTLDRAIPTLSGGEMQRLQLVSQLNSGLSNILYILDEPTTGLHPKDYDKLMDIIFRLKEQHNTIIIVEHAPVIMMKADHMIDIGPGAGIYGGALIAQGTPQQIIQNANSETGFYLSGKKELIVQNKSNYNIQNLWISIKGIQGNNLQNIDIKFPLQAITCITGVSGSGKSSLVNNGILPAVSSCIDKTMPTVRKFRKVTGAEKIGNIIHMTQKPIGKSSRSTPATYIGMMDEIRTLFTNTHKAKELKYSQSKFSYNTKEGQCSSCKGLGYITLDAAFASTNKIECPLCKGQKYHLDTLSILYKEKNIAQVLDMSVSEALQFFQDNQKLKSMLQVLEDIGLGYLSLGQSSQTLSGGEAQRIKLATELNLNNSNNTLYVLDEPTTGLHFKDIQDLLEILSKITRQGNSVILIEHNLDVIRNADWIIDLGPGGGSHGGKVIAQGTPSDIKKCNDSHTGRLLKEITSK